MEEMSVDQVRRKWEFEARNPEVGIQASRDKDGVIIFTARFGGEPFEARELREILDVLDDPELQSVVAGWGKYYAVSYSRGRYCAERRDDGARMHCRGIDSLLEEIKQNYADDPVTLPD